MVWLLLMTVASAQVTGVKITEWGVYDKVDERQQQEAEFATSGTIHSVGQHAPKLLKRTDRILARVGTRFGIQYVGQGDGFEKRPIVVRVLHPPLKNPATGQFTTSDQWTAESQVGISRFTGWLFEQEWELVEGEWVFQIVNSRGGIEDERRFLVVRGP